MLNTIIFSTKRIRSAPEKAMRVRGGKAGKVRTDLNVLAKAEQHYAGGGPSTKQSNAHLFKRYDQTYNKQLGWKYTTTIGQVRKPLAVNTTGLFAKDCISNVNNLLRNLLLFRGVNYSKIEQDIRTFEFTRKSKLARIEVLLKDNLTTPRYKILCQLKEYWKLCKPHANYAVNTTVEVDADGTNIAADIRCLRVNKITVQKVYKNIVNVMGKEEVQYSIIFKKESCRPIKTWLDSLTLELN